MNKTSLKQKLLLLILGLCLTVIFLEIGLRIAGAFVLFLQERHNHRLSFNQNEYRILCLGESTTALGGEDSYPSLLEEMLNNLSPNKKFIVINKGIVSTTSEYIFSHAEQNLDLYKPQLVIVMMGINDKAYLHGPRKSLWWENIKSDLKDFRVYKLVHLLYERTTHRTQRINSPAQIEDELVLDGNNYQQLENFLKLVIAQSIKSFSEHMSNSEQYQHNNQMAQALQEKQYAKQSAMQASLACVELARRYRLQGSLQEAQNILNEVNNLGPDFSDFYQEQGELYLAQKKGQDAVKAFQTGLSLDPQNADILLGLAHAYYLTGNDNAFLIYTGYLQAKPGDYWGFIELAQWLRKARHYDLAEGYLNRAIEIEPDFYQAFADLGQILDDQGQYEKEEAFYLKEIMIHPKNTRLYQALAQFYNRQNKEDLSKEYFLKAAQSDMSEYYPATLVNYSLLLDKMINRHIKVIVMQYPLRDISYLKNYLGNKNGVTFVENKENFKLALSKKNYSYYFKDNFAYNFGHCTRAGNELIARQLSEVILNNE